MALRLIKNILGRPMTGRAGSALGRPGSSMTNRGIPGTASRYRTVETEYSVKNQGRELGYQEQYPSRELGFQKQYPGRKLGTRNCTRVDI